MTEEEKRKIFQVLSYLESKGVKYDEPLFHPRVITCEDSLSHYQKAGYDLEDYSLCKNVFIRDKRGRYFFLLILDYDTEIDLDAIREKILLPRLVSATKEDVKTLLDAEKGSISIFNLLNNSADNVRVIIDKKVLGKKAMAFHPNTNCATLFLTKENVFAFLESIGHEPIVTEIGLYGKVLEKEMPKVINY